MLHRNSYKHVHIHDFQASILHRCGPSMTSGDRFSTAGCASGQCTWASKRAARPSSVSTHQSGEGDLAARRSRPHSHMLDPDVRW